MPAPTPTTAGRLVTQSLTLPSLLRSRKSFLLPSSQRVYGWHEEQVNRWFADVTMRCRELDVALPAPPWFFFGTIYLGGLGDVAEIADGQQRIVSATMLYAAARDLEDDPARRATLSACVVDRDGDYRLTLRDIDAAFFRTWVQEAGATLRPFKLEEDEAGDTVVLSDSQTNLIANRNLIVERLRSLGPDGRREFLDFMERASELVVIAAPRPQEALSAYASTHKRGLRQAETDKVKSELIGDAPVEVRGELANHWDECEARLGKEGLEDALQMLVFAMKGAMPSVDLLSAIEATFDLPRQVATFIPERLVPASKAYGLIASSGDRIAERLGLGTFEFRRAKRLQGHLVTLNRVALFGHAEWKAPAMTALERLAGDAALLERVLAGLERMSAAFMISGHEPHDAAQRYAALCAAIEAKDARAIDAALVVDGAIKQRARVQLASANFGTKPRYRMPVLLKINDLLAGDVEPVNPLEVTCEHILPQNVSRQDSVWRTAFLSDNGRRYIGQHYRHRLGNLTVLSHADNRRAGSIPFPQKKPVFAASGLAISRHVAREPDWTPARVEARTQALCDMVAAHWQL
jgi:hypothetical protein